MSLEDVRGGVFLKTDGQVDPTALTLALAAGAKSRGAQVLSNTRVTGIKVTNNEVKEVVTDKGIIKTDVVINAAGLWGNDIANMVGITLPIIPMAHLYLITRPVKISRSLCPQSATLITWSISAARLAAWSPAAMSDNLSPGA